MNEIIEAINYEAEQFRMAFGKFRNSAHVIDESLCTKLLQIVSEIDNFLESRPKEIVIPREDKMSTITALKKSGIRKKFVCNQCGEVIIGQTFHDVTDHLKKLNHDDLKNFRKKESAGNISRKAKLESKSLPKKLKALLQKDNQKVFTESLDVAKKLLSSPDYQEIENTLIKVIKPAFPDQSLKIYFFGSRLSGIGTTHSDLDIFVDIGGFFNTFENRPSVETKRKLQIVQDILSKDPQWKRLIAIPNARVPILKILYKPKSINCDIGFSNSLGFCNTKLTKYMLELQPIARALAFFLKKWIERSRLGEHITTYSSVLLLITYLQMKKLLPSIKMLQEGLENQLSIGPWLAVFAEKSLDDLKLTKVPYTLENFKRELISLFRFYSTFDFKNKLICPYLGEVISIKDFETLPLVPRYVKYVMDEKHNKDALINISYMNIQDPFQLNHNVTKAVPSTVVLLLKQYFALSVNDLENDDKAKT